MRRLLPVLGLLLPAIATAQPVPSVEELGPWRLRCATDRMTDRSDCVLRYRDAIEAAAPGAGGALALEVIDRGGKLVPAVVARDLTLEGAARGLLALTASAQLRFPPSRYFDMPCGIEGRSLVCAPRGEDVARAAQELPSADRVLVRMVGFGAGTPDAQPTELPLSATVAALARFRSRAPEPPPPAREGVDARELLQRLQRLFGN